MTRCAVTEWRGLVRWALLFAVLVCGSGEIAFRLWSDSSEIASFTEKGYRADANPPVFRRVSLPAGCRAAEPAAESGVSEDARVIRCFGGSRAYEICGTPVDSVAGSPVVLNCATPGYGPAESILALAEYAQSDSSAPSILLIEPPHQVRYDILGDLWARMPPDAQGQWHRAIAGGLRSHIIDASALLSFFAARDLVRRTILAKKRSEQTVRDGFSAGPPSEGGRSEQTLSEIAVAPSVALVLRHIPATAARVSVVVSIRSSEPAPPAGAGDTLSGSDEDEALLLSALEGRGARIHRSSKNLSELSHDDLVGIANELQPPSDSSP